MPVLVSACLGGLKDFWRRGCGSLSASIAFFFLLSFVPLVSLILFLFGQVLTPGHKSFEFLQGFIHRFFVDIDPARGPLADAIQRVAPQLSLHGLMLVAFVFSSIQVFGEVDHALNVVFESGSRRNPVVATIVSVLLLGLTFTVLMASYVTTQGLDYLTENAKNMADLHRWALTFKHFALAHALPLLLVLGAVTLLYRFLPVSRPPWRKAAIGGILFGLLWELAKNLFSRYVARSPQLGRMYGPLFNVMLGLLWMYYSAALFLYCASVVHRLDFKKKR